MYLFSVHYAYNVSVCALNALFSCTILVEEIRAVHQWIQNKINCIQNVHNKVCLSQCAPTERHIMNDMQDESKEVKY